VRNWLKAGILDGGQMLFPEAGTPQGSPLSPLLCNIALHGFESVLAAVSKRYRIVVIRFADDFVILCEDLATLMKAIQKAQGLAGRDGATHQARQNPRDPHAVGYPTSAIYFTGRGASIRPSSIEREAEPA